MKHLLRALIPALALMTPVACGSADVETNDEPAEVVSAPQLTNLRISDTVTAGEELEALVQATDEDGIKDISFRVKFSVNGSSVEATSKLAGIPEGIISSDITLTLPFSQAGEYVLDITAIDIDGNESNTLTANVTSASE